MTRTLRCDRCGRTEVDDGTIMVMRRINGRWSCRDYYSCEARVIESTGQTSIAGAHPSFGEVMTQLRIGDLT